VDRRGRILVDTGRNDHCVTVIHKYESVTKKCGGKFTKRIGITASNKLNLLRGLCVSVENRDRGQACDFAILDGSEIIQGVQL